MIADATPLTFFQLLRGYRPPRFMCFMLGVWSIAMLAITWATAVRPMTVIRECEEFRLRFGADPVYRIGIADLRCEFQKADLERNGVHRRPDPNAGKRI